MVDADVKKIAVLFVDPHSNAQWSMVFTVGVNKYLSSLGDYIRVASCNPALRSMRNVGLTEIQSGKYAEIEHGSIIDRWL